MFSFINEGKAQSGTMPLIISVDVLSTSAHLNGKNSTV